MITEQKLRRKILIETMERLDDSAINCSSCPGHCCTFRANSMQITESEARDIANFLKEAGLDLAVWRQKMKDCIQEFRLDIALPTGTSKSIRKNYTCPFFKNSEKGCPLPVEIKPYGCLAFNPQKSHESKGDSCKSDRDLLLLHHKSLGGIDEKKLPIPVALFSLLSDC